METNQPKRRLYSKKYYPLVIPADPNIPITQSPTPKPIGWARLGVEFTRMIDGQPVTFVRLEDGSEGLLTDFIVRDAKPGEEGRRFISRIGDYMRDKKEFMFREVVKKRYSEAPITEREKRLFELGYFIAINNVHESLGLHAEVNIKSYPPDPPAPPTKAE